MSGGGRAAHSQASSVPADRTSTSNLQPAPKCQNVSFFAWKPDGPPPKHRKLDEGPPHKPSGDKSIVLSFVTWKPDEDTSIQDVRESYERAKLQFPSLPRLGERADHAPGLTKKLADSHLAESWDPFILTKWLLRYALLDDEKLANLRRQLKLIAQRVPNGTQWTARTEKCGLTPTDLHELLRTAFTSVPTDPRKLLGSAPTRSDNEVSSREPTPAGEFPYILRIAAALLHQATSFDALQTTFRRATAITRIVGYALMRVSEAAGEVTTPQVSIFYECPHTALIQPGQRLYEDAVQRQRRLAEAISQSCMLLVLGNGKSTGMERPRISVISHIG